MNIAPCAVGPCWLSILYIVVYTKLLISPSHPFSPLVTISLFSMSVSPGKHHALTVIWVSHIQQICTEPVISYASQISPSFCLITEYHSTLFSFQTANLLVVLNPTLSFIFSFHLALPPPHYLLSASPSLHFPGPCLASGPQYLCLHEYNNYLSHQDSWLQQIEVDSC